MPLATGGNSYLATVIDCCSRRVARWATADPMRTELVTEALKALTVCGVVRSAPFCHSDHGSRCASTCFATLCRDLGITQSIRGGGNECGQCACRIVQRRPQTRCPPVTRTTAAGMTPPRVAAKCSGGWSATTRNDDTPTAVISAPPPTKGPAPPLRCAKPHNHKSRVHHPGSKPPRSQPRTGDRKRPPAKQDQNALSGDHRTHSRKPRSQRRCSGATKFFAAEPLRAVRH